MVNYLFLNFKTYAEATGSNALVLAKILESLSSNSVELIPVVQATDLMAVSNEVSINVFAQHIDPVNFGSNTGHILPEAVKGSGAFGTVINHAENKRDNDFIKKAVKRCREVGLKVMLCAETKERAEQLAEFSPDFIAVEPPELIGGDISVSTANPELISSSVKAIHKINPKIIVITGAGIKNSTDVKIALSLGTKGVFVASGVIKSNNPKVAVEELLQGYI